MPTPKSIIEQYNGNYMTRRIKEDQPFDPDRPTWPEEPSRRAVESVENLLGELLLYKGFSTWWDGISDGWKEFIREDLERAWDRWDEES